ncbi:unnamed protein product [Euphydryas editha]|uniref:Reverse transcriptase domain-containing protein n=1 Tax=Euphydryas editha TaxID=104508 RepID=A0AAU9UZ81_EUPED|nr:unnamed protein product [Euphydryas editha]
MWYFLHTRGAQSSFSKGHSTETTLLHVTDDLIETSDKGLSSTIVLLDYSREFDCMHQDASAQELLLSKLELYGFSKNTCQWFRSFLQNVQKMGVSDNKDGTKRFSSIRSSIGLALEVVARTQDNF